MIVYISDKAEYKTITTLYSEIYAVDLKSACTIYDYMRITAKVTAVIDTESHIMSSRHSVIRIIMYHYPWRNNQY